MTEWKECKLGDVIISNCQSINKEYPHETIQYLDTSSITCGKIDSFQEISIDDAPSRAKRLVKDNDIIYSTVRPIQRHYGFIKNSLPNLVVSTGFSVIEASPKHAEPLYIYYFLTSDDIVETLDIIADGSTSAYPSLKPSDIEKLDILLPPLPEQKRIAGVLSSLDDKIDLLHRQNKTLEQMAETLFRKWLDGLDYSSNISDLINIRNGFAFKSKDFKGIGDNRVIKIKNISGDIVDINNTDFVDSTVINTIDSQFSISAGDILFAMTGAEIGKMGLVPQTTKKLWLNQRVGLFKEKFKGSRFLAYLQLKSDWGKDYIDNTATGSAQPNISGTGIENCEFPKFTMKQIIEYSNVLAQIYDKVIFNLGQIRTLEKLRDTLLPKLMSGEVRVDI